MTSTKPYLIRAFYEWINDNKYTPYLVLNATRAGVKVPTTHVEDGKIVLNIAPVAVRDMMIANKCIQFQARFSGVATQIYAPISAVVAIYAQENGRGMVFNEEEYQDDELAEETITSSATSSTVAGEPIKNRSPRGKPNLTVVK